MKSYDVAVIGGGFAGFAAALAAAREVASVILIEKGNALGGAAAEGMSVGAYLIIAFVGLNFVFELITNIVLSSAILRIINIRKKEN